MAQTHHDASARTPMHIAFDLMKLIGEQGGIRDFSTIGGDMDSVVKTLDGISNVNPGTTEHIVEIVRSLVVGHTITDLNGAAMAMNRLASAVMSLQGAPSPQMRPAPAPAPAHRPAAAMETRAATQQPPYQPPPAPPQPPHSQGPSGSSWGGPSWGGPPSGPQPGPQPSLAPQAPQAPQMLVNDEGNWQQPAAKQRKQAQLQNAATNIHMRPPHETGQRPAVDIRESITPDYIICLEDGKKMKMLKRHLRTSYGMSPEDYRMKWGLPSDYPMTAPNYALSKADHARNVGLGMARKRAKERAQQQAASQRVGYSEHV